MLAQITTDLSAIFASGEMTEQFTHTYGSTTESINAIFEDRYTDVLTGIQTSQPYIEILNEDMTNVSTSSTFTRNSDSTVYKIKRIEPDDQGLRRIFLTRSDK